jgi:uncharacterized membrane protein YoaK (UPF0700 family)
MTQTGRRDALVMLLTVAAGATNVLSLTGLGGVPASIMTANLVIAGLSTTHHEGALGWHAGVALAGFIVAVFVTTRLIRAGHKDAGETKRPTWPRPVAIALAAEAVPLAGVAVGWGVTGGRPGGAVQLVLCATAAFAMGIQSAAVRALEVAGLSSTFFTGTLTDTVRDLAGVGQLHWKRGAVGIVTLIAGAAAEGAVLSYGSQRLGSVLPVALVGCVVALSLHGFSREG